MAFGFIFMQEITREKFIEICNEAIHKTCQDVVPGNQLSGYIQFHNAIKNDFIDKVLRPALFKTQVDDYALRHAIIKKAGVGNCYERAYYLAVELTRRLTQAGTQAVIFLVASKTVDHVFNRVEIKLQGELKPSLWEVDAWDPRIIDITQRPNKTRKNAEFLKYGEEVNIKRFFSTADFQEITPAQAIPAIKPPEKGRALRSPTPEPDMLAKHDWLYSDQTVKAAYKAHSLCTPAKMHYMQKISLWQKDTPDKGECSSSTFNCM